MVDVKFSMFFDRAGVQRKVKDGTKSVLAKAGAFVRQRAKTSIRKRRRIATAGSPPSSHAGQLRDLLLFGYDERTSSVVVGPQLFRHRSNSTVPGLLEFGGITHDARGRRLNYRAFPYMGPALEKEKGKFPGLFSGAVKD